MPSSPIALRVPLSAQALAETSGRLWRPDNDLGTLGVVLAPGAGATLTHRTLSAIAEGIAGRGYPVLTFNFVYAEAGRRSPDPTPRLLSAYADAVAAARRLMGERALVLGGRSMGGRMASLLMAGAEGAAAGLALLSYPLHRPASRGAASEQPLRTDHWPQLRVPVLFVVGDRDPMCDLAVLERERRERLASSPSTVHVIRGADHSLRVGKRDGRDGEEVLAEAAEAVARWLDDLPVGARVGKGSGT